MKLFKNRCYNGGKKHKFEPRCDEVQIDGDLEVKGMSPKDYRSLIFHNVYLVDICVWCGKRIDKNDPK